MTEHDEAAARLPELSKDDIIASLGVQQRHWRDEIAKNQEVRAEANAKIKYARSELEDVERMLAATKPRTRKAATS